MTARSLFAVSSLVLVSLGTASESLALANRVFVPARSGNDANTCDDVNAPCKTFAGAVTKLNPDGEVIVLDSGGYGPVTITQGVTIEAPTGVTAFVHPSSGDAITINAAGTATVTLRGLVLNGGTDDGIQINSVGTLNVENCFISGFIHSGIKMLSAGQLNIKGTDVKTSQIGIEISSTSGLMRASIDHCHLDGNLHGYQAGSSGTSRMTASYTTANNNASIGWICGGGTGTNVLILEFCTGSENAGDGLLSQGMAAPSTIRYSNCVFANNGVFGVQSTNSGILETRGNNTITGNGTAPTSGTIGTFPPM